MVFADVQMKRRIFDSNLSPQQLVVWNCLMMAKYLIDNLDPAVIRAKLEGTRKYLP